MVRGGGVLFAGKWVGKGASAEANKSFISSSGRDNGPNTAQGQPFTTRMALQAGDHENAKQDANYLLWFRNAFPVFSPHNAQRLYAPGNARNQRIFLQ